MVYVFLVSLGEAALAFVALDLAFRQMPVAAVHLRRSRDRWALTYSAAALILAAGGALVQWRAGGLPGLLLGATNGLPWWLLWRFGMRKQFTYLYKADGGSPMEGSEKPTR